jgi:hypothetical protein
MNRDQLRERVLQDEWPRQVGNLASTLARLGSRANDARYDQVVAGLLREGALLMEWCAPNVPLELAADLASMQRELILWHQIWPDNAARLLLAFRVREMADRLLKTAGFYG